jgi:hypothetical protein
MKLESGSFALVLGEHLGGRGEQLLRMGAAGKEANIVTGVGAVVFAAVAEHEHWQCGHAGVKLGNKCGPANSGKAVSCDNEAEVLGELRLLHKAKRFSGIGYT